MNALDRRLKAHAAKFAASWAETNPHDDRFFFRVEEFVVNVFCIGCDGAKEYGWNITHPDIWSQSGKPHASLGLAMYDAWAALVESMRALHAVDMPERTPERDSKAIILLQNAFAAQALEVYQGPMQ